MVFICFKERPLKIMKNVFYFMLKAPFVLEIFTFLSFLYSFVGKRLDKVNFKIYDVTDCIANNKTYIAQYLRSKFDQKIKFGHLIECKLRNTFLEKPYTKCGEEASPGPFYKKSKFSISLYIVCPSRGLLKYIKTKVLTTFFFLL